MAEIAELGNLVISSSIFNPCSTSFSEETMLVTKPCEKASEAEMSLADMPEYRQYSEFWLK